MLEVQKLFQEQHSVGGPEAFRNAVKLRGIDIRDYPEHQLLHLDYSQIEVDKFDPIGRECRGLILDYDGNIVCKSFDRFFNLGECGVDTFDFENSIAYEKADGSLVRIYYCKATQQWEIATRGTAFAEGPHEFHGTFRNFILKCMDRTEEQFQIDCRLYLTPGITTIFEAIGPDNRIVTPYKVNELVYLGMVISDMERVEDVAPTLEEANWFMNYVGWNVRPLVEYKFDTKEHCMQALEGLTDLAEGYVVYNKLTGERVKIKNAVYLAAHRLRGNGLTVNAICELVAMGEVEEYTATFPEDAWKFDTAINELAIMKGLLINNYIAACHYTDQFKGLPTEQKEFALYVKDLSLSCVMFKARKTGEDVIHEFNQFPVSKRAEWIKERLVK